MKKAVGLRDLEGEANMADKEQIKAVASALDDCAARVVTTKEDRPATRRQCWCLATMIVERGEDVSKFQGHPLTLRDA